MLSVKYSLPVPFVADLISIATVAPLVVSETVNFLDENAAPVVVPISTRPSLKMRSLSLPVAVPPVWNIRFPAGADTALSFTPNPTQPPLP